MEKKKLHVMIILRGNAAAVVETIKLGEDMGEFLNLLQNVNK